MDSQELGAQNQKQILDSLKFLMEELPRKERNASMFKLALQNIGALVTAGKAIAEHWDKLKHLLENLVK